MSEVKRWQMECGWAGKGANKDGYMMFPRPEGDYVLHSDYTVLEERVRVLTAALTLARPVLDEELQTLCQSYCPPCKVGEFYDYSELSEPELGYITRTEGALDAVDAVLALPQDARQAQGGAE